MKQLELLSDQALTNNNRPIDNVQISGSVKIKKAVSIK